MDVWRKRGSEQAKQFYRNSGREPCRRKEKDGQNDQTASNFARQTPPDMCLKKLAARLGGCGGGLRIRLRDAQIAADRVLAYPVDNDLFWNVRSREVEEDRLAHGHILRLEMAVSCRQRGR